VFSPRLKGNGKLRFVIQKNWRDLMFPDWLLERLNDWAARSMGMISTSGASDTWGDESSFAAAVFVLCRRVVQWKLTDRQEGTKVSCLHRGAAVYES